MDFMSVPQMDIMDIMDIMKIPQINIIPPHLKKKERTLNIWPKWTL